MPDEATALQVLPQFAYEDLVKLEADQRQLKVQGMQQLLRRAAALFDYLDDLTLPVPVLGEIVDLIAASPILLAGAIGALEQLGRRNPRGAFVEVVGSLAEAAITAVPGVEAIDLLTLPMQGKRTATMAREFVEQRIAGDTPRTGLWTTRDEQAYYIEPSGDGYIVSHHGRAGNVSQSPLSRVRYTKNGQHSVWTAQTNQWSPVAAYTGQHTTKLK